MQAMLTTVAIAILAIASVPQAHAGGDDVIVDGRIITGENPAASGGGSRHTGGVNVMLGDGSVRGGGAVGGNESISVGSNQTEAPKGGRLGSLNGVGSIGQLAAPPGAPPAQSQHNLKQLGLGTHEYGGTAVGDGNGDAKPGNLAGAGQGASGAPRLSAIDAGRNAGPKPGGGPQVKVFDGRANAAAGVGTMTMKGQKIGQN